MADINQDTFKANIQLVHFRDEGFDEESIEAAASALSNGVDKDCVDCFMSKKISTPQRLALAKFFEEGMPFTLGTKIIAREEGQIDVILEHMKNRIPFEAVEQIVDKNSSANHLRVAFEKYVKHILEATGTPDEVSGGQKKSSTAKSVKGSGQRKSADKEKEATEQVEEPAPEPISELTLKPIPDPAPEVAIESDESASPPADKSETEKVAPVTAKDNSLELFTSAITSINAQNMAMFEKLMERSEQNTRTIIESIAKSDREPVARTIEIPVNEESDRSGEPSQAGMPKRAEQMEQAEQIKRDDDVEKTAPTYAYQDTNRQGMKSVSDGDGISGVGDSGKLPDEVIGITRMIMMPDGSLHSVYVERTDTTKPKGLMGFASKVFGKDSPQNALLKQLIEGRLSRDQLNVIQKAVRSRLTPVEVKDLIESNLAPDEMDSIVDIVIAERQTKMGVM